MQTFSDRTSDLIGRLRLRRQRSVTLCPPRCNSGRCDDPRSSRILPRSSRCRVPEAHRPYYAGQTGARPLAASQRSANVRIAGPPRSSGSLARQTCKAGNEAACPERTRGQPWKSSTAQERIISGKREASRSLFCSSRGIIGTTMAIRLAWLRISTSPRGSDNSTR